MFLTIWVYLTLLYVVGGTSDISTIEVVPGIIHHGTFDECTAVNLNVRSSVQECQDLCLSNNFFPLEPPVADHDIGTGPRIASYKGWGACECCLLPEGQEKSKYSIKYEADHSLNRIMYRKEDELKVEEVLQKYTEVYHSDGQHHIYCVEDTVHVIGAEVNAQIAERMNSKNKPVQGCTQDYELYRKQYVLVDGCGPVENHQKAPFMVLATCNSPRPALYLTSCNPRTFGKPRRPKKRAEPPPNRLLRH